MGYGGQAAQQEFAWCFRVRLRNSGTRFAVGDFLFPCCQFGSVEIELGRVALEIRSNRLNPGALGDGFLLLALAPRWARSLRTSYLVATLPLR